MPSSHSGTSHLHFYGDGREFGSSRDRQRGESQAKSVCAPLDKVPLADLVRDSPDPALVFGSFDLQELDLRHLFAKAGRSNFLSRHEYFRTLAGPVARFLSFKKYARDKKIKL